MSYSLSSSASSRTICWPTIYSTFINQLTVPVTAPKQPFSRSLITLHVLSMKAKSLSSFCSICLQPVIPLTTPFFCHVSEVGMQLSWQSIGPARRRRRFDFPVRQGIFSPRVNFQCRLSYGVRTQQCAMACIYTCVHVKDPVVHVRVRLIMETLKKKETRKKQHISQVGQPNCHIWLSPGKAT